MFEDDEIPNHGRLIACDDLAGLLHQMDGLIRFRVPAPTPSRSAMGRENCPTCTSMATRDRWLELECRDVKTSLMCLISLLNELKLELVNLEMTELNLELRSSISPSCALAIRRTPMLIWTLAKKRSTTPDA